MARFLNTVIVVTLCAFAFALWRTHVASAPLILAMNFPTLEVVISAGVGETNALQEMLPMLRSMQLLSKARLRITILTNPTGREAALELVDATGPPQASPVDVCIRVQVVDEARVRAMAAEIDFDPDHHHSGIWGALKMFVPWLLPDLGDFILVDTDIVFLQDPLLLAAEMHRGGPDWVYRMVLDTGCTGIGACINSGVVLVRASKARKRALYPNGFKRVLADAVPGAECKKGGRGARCGWGDQSLYFALWKDKRTADVMAALDRKWNLDRCHEYGGGEVKKADGAVGILHRNCGPKKNDDTDVFFDFFRAYKSQWLGGGGHLQVVEGLGVPCQHEG